MRVDQWEMSYSFPMIHIFIPWSIQKKKKVNEDPYDHGFTRLDRTYAHSKDSLQDIVDQNMRVFV